MTRNGAGNPARFAKLLIGTTALVGTLFAAGPVLAQNAAPSSSQNDAAGAGGIEQVVVTARARSENIENVPAQVTAFTEADIQAMGIQKPQDFLDAVPNVTFIQTQNAGTSFLVMRGIAQQRNSPPSAAIVVDGVPMTQPADFNQELLDIKQIEVVKGPQGALYGRNAIGGAIIITTRQPTDTWQGHITAGYESGPGGKVEGVISGPVTDTLKVRAAAYYFDTQGHLINHDTVDKSAKRHADPVSDFSGRFTALYQPTSNFTADLRLSTDLLKTRGLYYIIPPFGSKYFNDPNYTSQPIDMNNSGKDDRKIYNADLKMTYDTPAGTFLSITGYNSVWEILTGDGYPFAPFDPAANTGGPCTINPICFNYNQSQFLKVKTFTQELRFTSPSDRRFRWIVGGEIFNTDRFISTGNMFDANDEGVAPEYYTPFPYFYPNFQPHGQVSFLADTQHQFAWAIYADTSYSITDQIELSLNARYDSDHREDTTDTPQFFLDLANIPTQTGDTRKHTWSAFEPQAILRYKPTTNLNLYVSYSRGFRSGGFNQTGVATAAAAAGFDNVGDLFNQETADTYEAGFKSRWFDDQLVLNGSIFTTNDKGAYYFVFLASNSTQNLGNIAETRLKGLDLNATARLAPGLVTNVGFGYTDSRIKKFPGASSSLVVGSRAPLVSLYTLNVGVQYDRELFSGVDGLVRVDYNRIGPTTFVIPVPAAGEPNPIARNPVDLVALRAGIQGADWSVMFWSKNLFNVKYNTEYSTGGFLFKGQPMSWGIDFTKRF